MDSGELLYCDKVFCVAKDCQLNNYNILTGIMDFSLGDKLLNVPALVELLNQAFDSFLV